MQSLDLGTFPGTFQSSAYAINNSGHVVGDFQFLIDKSGPNFIIHSHAFLYSGSGPIQEIGTLGGPESEARGINNSGQIVGQAYTANMEAHAFVYSDGIMTDLNSLIDPAAGWQLQMATAINDQGQIVGYGFKSDGAGRAFLLTPVPEPSTVTLLGIVGISLFAFGNPYEKVRKRC